jgi:molecular chaperone DnaK
MVRTTVDFGIDLGTTNSAIALGKGEQQEVFKNNEGGEYTPSAVSIDRRNALIVGRVAKEAFESDGDNAFCEFKLQMGTDRQYVFARSGRRMRPEELSAEVLKSLKADVNQHTGENVGAAVITVPAAFELPQCDATKKAAQLAGLGFSPLLQEPVAAALAYGLRSDSDKVFWLVYDLGGGTFDAAVIQFRDGVIQVPNHGGDNHLGGKLIDWEIVDQLLIPAVTREHRLTDFRRGNPKWAPAIAKLKSYAEEAKIRCSRTDSAPINIDFLCQDDRGDSVQFDYDLKRSEVEKLTEPFIVRSINICKKVLAERRLGVNDIEKVLLVGGPTLAPYLRERLADPKEGLGAPLEFSIDPLTVVARGAAVFAGGQRIEGRAPRPTAAGQLGIQLEYKPTGADTEPWVAGKVVTREGDDLSRFSIEFVNADAQAQWRSGKIGLAPDGTFLAQLRAKEGKLNTFLIELFDGAGTRRQSVPDRFTYSATMDMPEQPLVQSVGIALANNTVEVFFEKGTPLPVRRRKFLKTAVEARCGQAVPVIRIPVIEGENKRAERNRLIGSLEILGTKIKRDVPAGSEVEVFIQIDESRTPIAKAFIPILDEEYENVLKYDKVPPKPEELATEVDSEKKRLDHVRSKARETSDLKAQQVLQRIDGERMLHDVEAALAASTSDPDAADKCEKRLLDLQLSIDELEESLKWPALVAEGEHELGYMKEIVQAYGNSTDKQTGSTLEREFRQAMEARDPDLLRRRIAEVESHRFTVWRRHDSYWVAFFQFLEQQRSSMRNQSDAAEYFQQGQRAINTGDRPALEAACQQLVALLPVPPPPVFGGRFGGTLH